MHVLSSISLRIIRTSIELYARWFVSLLRFPEYEYTYRSTLDRISCFKNKSYICVHIIIIYMYLYTRAYLYAIVTRWACLAQSMLFFALLFDFTASQNTVYVYEKKYIYIYYRCIHMASHAHYSYIISNSMIIISYSMTWTDVYSNLLASYCIGIDRLCVRSMLFFEVRAIKAF